MNWSQRKGSGQYLHPARQDVAILAACAWVTFKYGLALPKDAQTALATLAAGGLAIAALMVTALTFFIGALESSRRLGPFRQAGAAKAACTLFSLPIYGSLALTLLSTSALVISQFPAEATRLVIPLSICCGWQMLRCCNFWLFIVSGLTEPMPIREVSPEELKAHPELAS